LVGENHGCFELSLDFKSCNRIEFCIHERCVCYLSLERWAVISATSLICYCVHILLVASISVRCTYYRWQVYRGMEYHCRTRSACPRVVCSADTDRQEVRIGGTGTNDMAWAAGTIVRELSNECARYELELTSFANWVVGASRIARLNHEDIRHRSTRSIFSLDPT
jgi:hypothetical protein